jgi:hypothetical protein
MHQMSFQPMTRREYGRIMRRFRKAIIRSLAFGLLLLPLHVASAASRGALEPFHVAFALLAGTVSAMLIISALGMVIAWGKRPRQLSGEDER